MNVKHWAIVLSCLHLCVFYLFPNSCVWCHFHTFWYAQQRAENGSHLLTFPTAIKCPLLITVQQSNQTFGFCVGHGAIIQGNCNRKWILRRVPSGWIICIDDISIVIYRMCTDQCTTCIWCKAVTDTQALTPNIQYRNTVQNYMIVQHHHYFWNNWWFSKINVWIKPMLSQWVVLECHSTNHSA